MRVAASRATAGTTWAYRSAMTPNTPVLVGPAQLTALVDQFNAIEESNSGLVRSTTSRDQKDPHASYMIVAFESEEKARARERDPRRQEALEPARRTMAEIFDGPPEFLDLEVIAEHSGT